MRLSAELKRELQDGGGAYNLWKQDALIHKAKSAEADAEAELHHMVLSDGVKEDGLEYRKVAWLGHKGKQTADKLTRKKLNHL